MSHSCVGAGDGCCARHKHAHGCSRVKPPPKDRAAAAASSAAASSLSSTMMKSLGTAVHIVFASKHPDRGAALVRGTQVANGWPSSLMLGGAQIHEIGRRCARLASKQQSSCASLSKRLLVVHLKDLSTSLFTQLPGASHVLDPIDKIYRGFSVPSDPRLCGLVTHSAAQARLYQSKGARGRAWVVPDHGLPGCSASPSGLSDPRAIFARRTVLVLGGAPSAPLRAALQRWADGATRRVTVLYEKDLRANIAFSQSHWWSGWLCSLLSADQRTVERRRDRRRQRARPRTGPSDGHC